MPNVSIAIRQPSSVATITANQGRQQPAEIGGTINVRCSACALHGGQVRVTTAVHRLAVDRLVVVGLAVF